MDATLSLLSLAVVAPSHGNMLVGAGIIPTLIELIKDTNPKHGGVSHKDKATSRYGGLTYL